ncbi:MAG: YbgA family protein [Acidobacteriota bacterium]
MKPNIVLSECINFKPVRFDGGIIKDPFANTLDQHVNYLPVCPEMAIGLGVPRDRVKVVRKNKKNFRLIQPKTGLDLTKKMSRFSEEFLNSLEEIDGFLLKSKSPSCGVSGTKTYANMDGTGFLYRGKGVFARKVIQKFPGLPCEDERRLKDINLRTHFLTRIFSLFELRTEFKNLTSIKNIRDFHKKYRYLIMSYNQTRLKNLEKIISNKKDQSIQDVKKAYQLEFIKTFLKKPPTKSHVYVLRLIFENLSDYFSPGEKHHFLDILEKYRNKKIPVTIPLGFLRNSAQKFKKANWHNQKYLNPYPEKLIDY